MIEGIEVGLDDGGPEQAPPNGAHALLDDVRVVVAALVVWLGLVRLRLLRPPALDDVDSICALGLRGSRGGCRSVASEDLGRGRVLAGEVLEAVVVGGRDEARLRERLPNAGAPAAFGDLLEELVRYGDGLELAVEGDAHLEEVDEEPAVVSSDVSDAGFEEVVDVVELRSEGGGGVDYCALGLGPLTKFFLALVLCCNRV